MARIKAPPRHDRAPHAPPTGFKPSEGGSAVVRQPGVKLPNPLTEQEVANLRALWDLANNTGGMVYQIAAGVD